MLARLKSLIKQSAIYGLGNLLIQGAKFLLLPLYTQFLSPADYGILSVVMAYESVLTILTKLGLDSTITRFHYDFRDEKERRRYYGSIWVFLTGFTLGIVLLLNWKGQILFDLIFRDIPFYPYGQLATWLSFITTASVIPLVLFRVREQAPYYILSTFGRFILTTTLIIFFVTGLGQKAEGSLRGQLIGEALLFIPFTLVAWRSLHISFDWKQVKASLAFGLPIVPHQLSGWALSMSDRLILNRFVSLEQQGLYALGYRFGMFLDVLLQSINLAWAPMFYRMASSEKEAPQMIAKITTYYWCVILFLGLGISSLSKDVIRIMAKPAYYPAHQIVTIVVIGFLIHGLYFMVVNQLFYAKETKQLPIYTLISAGTNIGLNLVTVPVYGIVAAAWNTTLGYTLLFLLVFNHSRKIYPIPYEYRRLGLLTFCALAVYFPIGFIQFANPFINLALRSLALSAYPLSLFLLHFFTAQELNTFKGLLRKYTKIILP